MRFEETDGGNLVVYVDKSERKNLRLHGDIIQTDNFMHEWFDNFLHEVEWDWIRPEENGDLTDAPILGIPGEPDRRYGFMGYCFASVLEELRDKGHCIFLGPKGIMPFV